MKPQIQKTGKVTTAPAYPFSPRDLFRDLRSQLADEHGSPMQFDRLAQMAGKYKSTIHAWFETYHHPHIMAFMLLLERLSPDRRRCFLENHCRVYPTFFHPQLAHDSENLLIMRDLLSRKTGLSIINGPAGAQHFVFTALGHAVKLASRKACAVAGIDLSRPTKFVPVENLVYIDPTLPLEDIRKHILAALRRVLVSRAPVLLFNDVWSMVPSVREDILRCAVNKHVIIANEAAPDWEKAGDAIGAAVHMVSISCVQASNRGIRVRLRLP